MSTGSASLDPSAPQNNPPLSTSSAEETFSAKGKKIGAGKEKLRLNVSDDTNTDKRMAIAAKESLPPKERSGPSLRKFARSVRYVKYEVNGESVDLNINSLSKRLHLSKKVIRQAEKEGELGKLLEKAKTEALSKALDHYSQVFEHRKIHSKEGLSTKILMKATKEGLSVLGNLQVQEAVDPEKQKYHEYKIGDHRFAVLLPDEQNTSLKILAYGRRLGSGSFGVVSAAVVLNEPAKLAVKTDLDVRPGNDISNEFEILNVLKDQDIAKELHKDGEEVVGILPPPVLVEVITGGHQGTVSEMHMVRCDGDLELALRASIEEKMEITRQLLSGVANLEIARIGHFDIKPQNILVKKDESGKWKAYIADFGGAKKYNKDHQGIDIGTYRLPVHTPDYTPISLKEEYSYSNAQKRDRFAMGKVLFELFTSDKSESTFSYDLSEYVKYDRETENKVKEELKKAGVPETMRTIITDLLNIECTKSTGDFLIAFAQIDSKPADESTRTTKESITTDVENWIAGIPIKIFQINNIIDNASENKIYLVTDNIKNQYNDIKKEIAKFDLFYSKNPNLNENQKAVKLAYEKQKEMIEWHAFLSIRSIDKSSSCHNDYKKAYETLKSLDEQIANDQNEELNTAKNEIIECLKIHAKLNADASKDQIDNLRRAIKDAEDILVRKSAAKPEAPLEPEVVPNEVEEVNQVDLKRVTLTYGDDKGVVFEGFVDGEGRRQGMGTFHNYVKPGESLKFKYTGEFLNDKMQGQGTIIFGEGTKEEHTITGTWENNEFKEGTGKLFIEWEQGVEAAYEGEIGTGFLPNGKGVVTKADGTQYDTVWENGTFKESTALPKANSYPDNTETVARSDLVVDEEAKSLLNDRSVITPRSTEESKPSLPTSTPSDATSNEQGVMSTQSIEQVGETIAKSEQTPINPREKNIKGIESAESQKINLAAQGEGLTSGETYLTSLSNYWGEMDRPKTEEILSKGPIGGWLIRESARGPCLSIKVGDNYYEHQILLMVSTAPKEDLLYYLDNYENTTPINKPNEQGVMSTQSIEQAGKTFAKSEQTPIIATLPQTPNEATEKEPFRFSNGGVYVGRLENNLPNGWGKATNAEGTVFEGEFRNGALNGYGKMYTKNGNSYEGEFRNNQLHGKGTLVIIGEKMTVIKDGEFFEGKFLGGTRAVSKNGKDQAQINLYGKGKVEDKLREKKARFDREKIRVESITRNTKNS